MFSTRPKLSYVVNTLNAGGTEKLVVEMSLAFTAEFDVSVVCLDEPGLWARDLRARGIPVHCLWRQPGFDVAMPVRLADYFRKMETQVIHAHQCTAWFYSALSRLIYRAPRLLLQEHGRFFPEQENRMRAFGNRWIIRPLTHRFVAVSEDIRSRLERYEGLDCGQIEVVYNGVIPDPPVSDAERAALRDELGFGSDDFVVGTVGRMAPIKNLPLLVNSLHRSAQEVPSVRGLLVGDGPAFADTCTLLKKLGLSEVVRVTGFRDDARRLIQCMDMFVLSSFSEGISVALLEAIDAGVPVAVTNVGGNGEVVVNGKTGWSVPSDDRDAMTAVIVDAARNPARRQALIRAGRCRFEEQFTFDRMLERYAAIYRTLVGRNG